MRGLSIVLGICLLFAASSCIRQNGSKTEAAIPKPGPWRGTIIGTGEGLTREVTNQFLAGGDPEANGEIVLVNGIHKYMVTSEKLACPRVFDLAPQTTSDEIHLALSSDAVASCRGSCRPSWCVSYSTGCACTDIAAAPYTYKTAAASTERCFDDPRPALDWLWSREGGGN